jgi:hypothetical protein
VPTFGAWRRRSVLCRKLTRQVRQPRKPGPPVHLGFTPRKHGNDCQVLRTQLGSLLEKGSRPLQDWRLEAVIGGERKPNIKYEQGGRIMRAAIAAALAFALLAGCATPYQPFALLGRGGYTDEALGGDRFQVTYYTNKLTGPENQHEMLLYRIAQVAVDHGYNKFGIARTVTTFGGRGFQSEQATVQMARSTETLIGAHWYLASKVLAEYGAKFNQQS